MGDDLIGKIMYKVTVGIFYIIGRILRFTFDVLVYLVTLGFYKMKERREEKKREGLPTFPLAKRFEHTHIVAGTGHGKTQLLQTMILDDIMELVKGNGSVIVIDSQGDMLKNIIRLGVMAHIKDRIILIDPYDVEHPPALNLFDFGLDRTTSYDPAQREQILNSAVSLYEYLFGALLGSELTARQGMLFRFLARLLMVVPGANINTFREFIRNPETTIPYYDRLDENARLFFETEFSNRVYDETRQQILTRLWTVLAEPTLAKMFSAEKNAINVFEAMNNGCLFLIYTGKASLKKESCQLLGRFCLALIAQATQERALLPEDRRRATFVYIDEAHEYFDESIEVMLTEARKQKVGLIIAHQSLAQLDDKLRKIIMGNTSIKLAGGLSRQDTDTFAQEFDCPVEWFADVEKTAQETQFVKWIKNQPPPEILRVPLLTMERQPKISEEEYQGIIVSNRRRYCQRTGKGPAGPKPPAPIKRLTEPEMI